VGFHRSNETKTLEPGRGHRAVLVPLSAAELSIPDYHVII